MTYCATYPSASARHKTVAHYWKTRAGQRDKQRRTGKADQGLRSAVTGGAQMDGVIDLFTDLISATGVPERFVFRKNAVELPGFFRPTKEWDLLVVREKTLLAAIEAKSQVGPSFGNNFNNRTEEAMGIALDLWTAYREHAYLIQPSAVLGPAIPDRVVTTTNSGFLLCHFVNFSVILNDKETNFW